MPKATSPTLRKVADTYFRWSPLVEKIRKLVEKEALSTPGSIPLYEEKGTYAGYVRIEQSSVSSLGQESSGAICPLTTGNLGQARP